MRKIFFSLLLAFFLVGMPIATQAAESTFFGPLVSASCDCPGKAPGFGCVLETIRLLMNFGISIAVVIVTLILAYAGFTFMMNASNPEGRSKAKNILINALIGIFIVLTAWLIIDFVMTRLYNPGSFGPWHSILYGNEDKNKLCIEPVTLEQIYNGPQGQAIPATSGSGGVASTGGGSAAGGGGTGSNCVVTEAQVIPFPASATDGGSDRRDLPDTVQRFLNMRAEALRAGITLRAGSAYRPDSEEVSLWNSHGCSRASGHTVCSPGQSIVAMPCALGGNGSNHTRGTAIDIQTDQRGTAWMVQYAARFGFLHRIASERWHWSDTGY